MRIRHRTTYRYASPVALQPHRLMLRPRDGFSIRVLSCGISVWPEAALSWSADVFGNAIAMASFSAMTDHLVVESDVCVENTLPSWPVFDIAHSAIYYPFRYSATEWLDLGSLAVPQYPDPQGRLNGWTRAFVASNSTDTLSLLKDLNAGIGYGFGYQTREAEGTQSPLETIDRGWGTCRDFAVLFADAARVLGFGARIVSGYLRDPDHRTMGGGSTHAWVDVFIPGAGWVSFDPTNGGVGGYNLIPVAVGRGIEQVVPVSGSFLGMSNAFLGMDVDVIVSV